jgi:hypothetical protein
VTDELDLSTLTAEQLIARIVQLDGYVTAESKRFAEFTKPHRDHVEACKNQLRSLMTEQGMDKLSTDSGTAYFSNILNPKVEDSDKFMEFVFKFWNAGGSDLLKIGAPQVDAIREYMDTHEGQLPPGVTVAPFSRLNIKAG